jgi:beta-lactamase superfamily II metal-dependent hydrolase
MLKVGRLCVLLNIALGFVLLTSVSASAKPVHAAGICGSGTWASGNLQVHHINIGQGDATLVVGPTGKLLLFDAGESYWNSSADAQITGPYIEGVLGCKSLDYVVISHFHVDHIGYVRYGGLWNLVETQGFTVGTTLVRLERPAHT